LLDSELLEEPDEPEEPEDSLPLEAELVADSVFVAGEFEVLDDSVLVDGVLVLDDSALVDVLLDVVEEAPSAPAFLADVVGCFERAGSCPEASCTYTTRKAALNMAAATPATVRRIRRVRRRIAARLLLASALAPCCSGP